MIDFSKIKIKKLLINGYRGKIYLVKYNNIKYELKILQVKKKEETKTKNLNYEIWRTLDLNDYIQKLKKSEQLFFMKIYGYNFLNCKPTDIMVPRLSNYCVKLLLEYKGKVDLFHFVKNKKIKNKRIYSICLQICNIIYILYLGGYSHYDLRLRNIMINKTKLNFFTIFNNNISYEGYQLSAVDYDNILTTKNVFIHPYYNSFFTDNEYWMFRGLFYSITILLFNHDDLPINNLTKVKILKLIIKHHSEFFYKSINKYIKIFPRGKKLELFITNIKTIENINFHKEIYFDDIVIRILFEFTIYYPELYVKYSNISTKYKSKLPNNILLEILLINNYKDFIQYFINKINN